MNFHLIQIKVSTWCSQYDGDETKVWGLARGAVLSLSGGIGDYLGPVAIQQTSQSDRERGWVEDIKHPDQQFL